ncbi:MAG: hypothetical protein ACJ72Q_01040 [Nitrososphaeraceae archaeon]|jgi:hypothetical protein
MIKGSSGGSSFIQYHCTIHPWMTGTKSLAVQRILVQDMIDHHIARPLIILKIIFPLTLIF